MIHAVATASVLAVSQTWRTFGLLLVAVLVIAFAVYIWFNIKAARPEIGAEVELAANRVVQDDEVLEGRRLESVQFWGVLFLLVIGVGLPLYWLREPGRQAGAAQGEDETAIARGEDSYLEGFQCANCHGADGGGGAAPYILPIPLFDDDGERRVDDEGVAVSYNVAVSWSAPDLTSVYARYSREEIKEILIYGRTNSPMPAWGVDGGGVGTDQQIENVLDYLLTIQREPAEIQAENRAAFDRAQEDAGGDFDGGLWLFQEHCARCHTQGWAWAENLSEETYSQIASELPDGVTLPVGPQGGGAFGPRLDAQGMADQFVTAQDQVDFISRGAQDNVAYGTRGLGGGQMPGFGDMLDEELIEAIVAWERSSDPDNAPIYIPGAPAPLPPGSTSPPGSPDEGTDAGGEGQDTVNETGDGTDAVVDEEG